MTTPDPTYPGSVRLPMSYWAKLRRLMQLHGRSWLERAIDRETRRVDKKAAK